MMSMLNTSIALVKANHRFAVFTSPDGRCFSLGKDFRETSEDKDDRQFGIPRLLNIK